MDTTKNSSLGFSPQNDDDLAMSSLRDILNRYTHCTICGANLHFTHFTDFSRNLTQEIAKCPECGVKARNVMHKLQ